MKYLSLTFIILLTLVIPLQANELSADELGLTNEQLQQENNTPKEVQKKYDIQNNDKNKKETEKTVQLYVPAIILKKGMIVEKEVIITKDFPFYAVPKNTLNDLKNIIGKQVKRTIYKERPFTMGDLGSIISIKRNDKINLVYQKGSIIMTTFGKALDEGGEGDSIRVMNLSSSKTVTGKILANGDVDVSMTN